MASLSDQLTIDIDTGGTFTDGTISDGKQVFAVKVLTTPHDLTVSFRNLIATAAERYGVEEVELLKRVVSIRYSTTIGTNTIIQKNGPRIGLLMLDSDLPLIRNLDDESLIGSILSPMENTVRGVDWRGVDSDAKRVLEAVEYLLEHGAERLVVAISRDSEEIERRIKRIILSEYPRHILGALPILFSTEISMDSDIFRRTATAVLNAYLHPSLEHFLYNTEDFLRGLRYKKPLFIFSNDGTSNRVAKVTALKTYNSGPAGGLEGAANLARHYDLDRVVTIDIGGTSTDLSFIVNGQIEEQNPGEIDGTEVSIPLRKIVPLGGGGGTIARVRDEEFQLGPDSAGAAPGPACFGFGGTEATVTDANVVCGYFKSNALLAGQVTIDGERAEKAVRTKVADPLGLSVEEAGLLIRETLEKRIGQAIRSRIESRGFHPGQFTLMAFGGAGPVHAAGIAAYAGINRVIIPDMCAIFSSFGIGFSDVVHRYERTIQPDAGQFQEAANALTERAMIDMRGEGFDRQSIELNWQIQLLDENGAAAILEDLKDAEQELAKRPNVTEVKMLLQAKGRLPHLSLEEKDRPDISPSPREHRMVVWSAEQRVETPIYHLRDLDQVRAVIRGPAVVEGDNTTVVVPDGWVLARDRYDQYFLTREV